MTGKLNTRITGERTTVALTEEQYVALVQLIRDGTPDGHIKPNSRVAMALILEANLGIRVSDIVKLRLSDIILDGQNYRLNITERKTGKRREFYVPQYLVFYIQNFCITNGINRDERIIAITTRQVQRVLHNAAYYLGYERISTHSFRKFFATKAYETSNYNLVLVQSLLQHSSASITQRYVRASSKEMIETLESIVEIV